VTFHKYSYDCNVIINIGSLVLPVYSKNVTLLSFHIWLMCDTTVHPPLASQKSLYFHCFSRKRSFQEYCGSGPGILNTDVGKWHFKECWIQYNYALFKWAIFQDWKKWTVIAGKWRTGVMDRGFIIYAKCTFITR